MGESISKLSARSERTDRVLSADQAAASATVSIRAFLAWLPEELRPDAVAARTCRLLLRRGRPAAVAEWERTKNGFHKVLAERGIAGGGTAKIYDAWRAEVGKLGAKRKARAIAENEAFWGIALSDAPKRPQDREDLLDVRNA